MRKSAVRNRALVAAAAVASCAVVIVPGASPAEAAPVTVTLLNINDFHGRIDTTNNLTTRWATTIEQERLVDSEALLFGAGDLIGATLFTSAVAQDQPTIDVMNEMCLNASAVGNHEFDQGFSDLTTRVIGGAAGQATDACPSFAGDQTPGTNALWSYLGANIYQKGTQTPALPEYATFVAHGVTVGVVGVVTSETPALVSPGGITTIDVGDPIDALNRVADQLTDGNPANGEADVLIAEVHEGAPSSLLTLDGNVAASPAFASIVQDTSPKYSVIFTGHTHQTYVYMAPVNGGATGEFRPILQSGNYADHVSKVVFSFDETATPQVSVVSAVNLLPAASPDLNLPRVNKVNSMVIAAKAFADTIGLQPIGSQTSSITTAYTGGTYTGTGDTYVIPGGPISKTGRDDRASESTLGDEVANMLRDTLAAPERGGAEIGIVNPGGLRDELFYNQVGVEGDGVITYAEANNVLPFVNNLWTTTLTGAQLKLVLEQQWQRDASNNVPSRPYLQLGLSDNVTYTWDDSLPEGSRITSITIDGLPVDPTADYRIATFSFLITGGDNFRAFLQGTDARDSGLVDREGWIAYLQNHPNVAPDFARQALKVTNLPTAVTPGTTMAFTVSKLDLTSLGSPANTSVEVTLGGVSLGTVPVTNGTAAISLGVPLNTPPGTRTLTVVATPSGTTMQVNVAVGVAADAGGPYTVAEGDGLTLDASGSTPGATYEWDLNGDDDFTDVTGVAPTLTWAQLDAFGIDDGPATYTITVRVTANSVSQTADAVVNVTNTAPTVVLTGPLTPTAGVPYTIKVGADDPSSADMAGMFHYTVDWGDGSPIESADGPSDPPFTHTYARSGVFSPTFTVTDKDGGGTTQSSVTLQVAPRRQLPATGDQQGNLLLIVMLLLVAGLGMMAITRVHRPAIRGRDQQGH